MDEGREGINNICRRPMRRAHIRTKDHKKQANPDSKQPIIYCFGQPMRLPLLRCDAPGDNRGKSMMIVRAIYFITSPRELSLIIPCGESKTRADSIHSYTKNPFVSCSQELIQVHCHSTIFTIHFGCLWLISQYDRDIQVLSNASTVFHRVRHRRQRFSKFSNC